MSRKYNKTLLIFQNLWSKSQSDEVLCNIKSAESCSTGRGRNIKGSSFGSIFNSRRVHYWRGGNIWRLFGCWYDEL